MAMFLAGDIGSHGGPDHRSARSPTRPATAARNGCFAQVELTGRRDRRPRRRRAGERAARAARARSTGERTEFCAPLENNLFRAAFEAGLFGERQGYTNCQPTGRVGNEVHTSVAVLDVGPDLQFIVNPGEAFPGADAGRPLGHRGRELPEPREPAGADLARAREVPLPGRARRRPDRLREAGLVVPVRHARRPSRRDGLHQRPARPQPRARGRGGRARPPSNMVAAEPHRPARPESRPGRRDPPRPLRQGGRHADRRLLGARRTRARRATSRPTRSRSGSPPRARRRSTPTPGHPDSGTIVALGSVGSFGDRQVDANGDFMDFDGAGAAERPGRHAPAGCSSRPPTAAVQKRYYVNVYPALTVSGRSVLRVQRGYPAPEGRDARSASR